LTPRLTVVIPAYNEEVRLGPTLDRIGAYLSAQDYPWSVLVVSDGSSDQTAAIAKAYADADSRFGLIAYTPNRGKGHAVRRGMLAATGDFRLLSDADLATPIEEIEHLWPPMAEGYEVAIGSRPLRESNLEIRQPLYRELLGRAFNGAVQTLGIRGIADTQCGFKLFTASAVREIFPRCKLDGFSFDFEALMIARDLDYRIAEIPIRWRHQEGSKVRVLRDGSRMLLDLVGLRLRGKRQRMMIRVP